MQEHMDRQREKEYLEPERMQRVAGQVRMLAQRIRWEGRLMAERQEAGEQEEAGRSIGMDETTYDLGLHLPAMRGKHLRQRGLIETIDWATSQMRHVDYYAGINEHKYMKYSMRPLWQTLLFGLLAVGLIFAVIELQHLGRAYPPIKDALPWLRLAMLLGAGGCALAAWPKYSPRDKQLS